MRKAILILHDLSITDLIELLLIAIVLPIESNTLWTHARNMRIRSAVALIVFDKQVEIHICIYDDMTIFRRNYACNYASNYDTDSSPLFAYVT